MAVREHDPLVSVVGFVPSGLHGAARVECGDAGAGRQLLRVLREYLAACQAAFVFTGPKLSQFCAGASPGGYVPSPQSAPAEARGTRRRWHSARRLPHHRHRHGRGVDSFHDRATHGQVFLLATAMPGDKGSTEGHRLDVYSARKKKETSTITFRPSPGFSTPPSCHRGNSGCSSRATAFPPHSLNAISSESPSQNILDHFSNHLN